MWCLRGFQRGKERRNSAKLGFRQISRHDTVRMAQPGLSNTMKLQGQAGEQRRKALSENTSLCYRKGWENQWGRGSLWGACRFWTLQVSPSSVSPRGLHCRHQKAGLLLQEWQGPLLFLPMCSWDGQPSLSYVPWCILIKTETAPVAS